MASIHLQGILRDSLGEIDVGAIITFTHMTTTGETIASTKRNLLIPPDGAYSIDVEYGQIRIDYTTRYTERFVSMVIVNQDSTATSLPELLNAAVPVTPAVILEMQGILADAVAASDTSEAFANQLTTFDLIGSAAAFAPDTNITTKGYLTSGDEGSGSWVQNGVTGQTPSQSPAQLGNALLNDGNGNQWRLVPRGRYNLRSLGGVGDGTTDDSDAIQAWWNAAILDLSVSEKQINANIPYVPIGNFTSTAGLVLTASKYQVQVEGDGWGSVLDRVDFVFNQPFCQLRNLALYGATSVGVEINGYDCLLFNCYIRDKTTHGAWFRNAAQSFIQNSFIHRCSNGLYYAGNPQGHSLSNSKVKACTSGGVLFENGGELKLSNNFIMGNANYGLKISNNAAAPDPGASQPIPIESYFNNNTITQNGGNQVYSISSLSSYDSGNKIQITMTTPHEFPVGFGNIQIDGTGDAAYDGIKSYAVDVISSTSVILDIPFSSAVSVGTLTSEGYDLILESDAPNNSRNFHFVGGNINNTLINGCYNLQFWGTRLKRRIWMKGSNNSQISFFRVAPTGENAGSTTTPSPSSERVKPIPISGPGSNRGWTEFAATQDGKSGWGAGGEALVMRTPALNTPLLPNQQPELLSEVMVGGGGVSVLNELSITRKFGGIFERFYSGVNERLLFGTDGSDNAQIFGRNSANSLTMFLSANPAGNSQIPSNINFGGTISTNYQQGFSGTVDLTVANTLTISNGLIIGVA